MKIRMRTRIRSPLNRVALMLVLSIAILPLSPVQGIAQEEELVNVGALFSIGMGARPLGMGGAFVGLADDENALFYNPAGLGFLKGFGLTSLSSNQFNAANYGALGYAQRNIGFGLLQLTAPGLTQRDELGVEQGEFDYTNHAAIASFGVAFGPLLSFGIRGKAYHVETLDEDTGTFSIDAAGMIKLGPLRFGALMENVSGAEIEYQSGHTEVWGQNVRVGASLKVGVQKLASLTLAMDIDHLLDERDRTLHAGAELWLGPLGLRGGIYGPLDKFLAFQLQDLAQLPLTAGASLVSGSFEINYAFLAHPDLPDTHRLSATLRFGR